MTHVYLQWHNPTNQADKGQALLVLPCTIGRAPDNDVVLPEANGGVSRHHAQLFSDWRGLGIADLHSSNGTLVNGRFIHQTTLTPNDHIQIGRYLLHLQTTIRCADDNCRRFISSHALTCPWCGHFQADVITRIG